MRVCMLAYEHTIKQRNTQCFLIQVFILYQEITGISSFNSLVQWLTNSGLGKWKSDSDSGFRKVMSAETRCTVCVVCVLGVYF